MVGWKPVRKTHDNVCVIGAVFILICHIAAQVTYRRRTSWMQAVTECQAGGTRLVNLPSDLKGWEVDPEGGSESWTDEFSVLTPWLYFEGFLTADNIKEAISMTSLTAADPLVCVLRCRNHPMFGLRNSSKGEICLCLNKTDFDYEQLQFVVDKDEEVICSNPMFRCGNKLKAGGNYAVYSGNERIQLFTQLPATYIWDTQCVSLGCVGPKRDVIQYSGRKCSDVIYGLCHNGRVQETYTRWEGFQRDSACRYLINTGQCPSSQMTQPIWVNIFQTTIHCNATNAVQCLELSAKADPVSRVTSCTAYDHQAKTSKVHYTCTALTSSEELPYLCQAGVPEKVVDFNNYTTRILPFNITFSAGIPSSTELLNIPFSVDIPGTSSPSEWSHAEHQQPPLYNSEIELVDITGIVVLAAIIFTVGINAIIFLIISYNYSRPNKETQYNLHFIDINKKELPQANIFSSIQSENSKQFYPNPTKIDTNNPSIDTPVPGKHNINNTTTTTIAEQQGNNNLDSDDYLVPTVVPTNTVSMRTAQRCESSTDPDTDQRYGSDDDDDDIKVEIRDPIPRHPAYDQLGRISSDGGGNEYDTPTRDQEGAYSQLEAQNRNKGDIVVHGVGTASPSLGYKVYGPEDNPIIESTYV